MNKKNLIFLSIAIVMSYILMLASSCEKDKSDPVITWINPVDIIYGTLLSELQLNATSNVSGVFIYTPTIGEKLREGSNQDLSVVFKPTDGGTYNSVNKTVRINVLASDIEGNVYKVVTIGTQTWMVENLKTTKYNDGTSIPYVTDESEWYNLSSPAYCWYNNEASSKKDTFGALYNWYALNTHKLAPSGWHISTDSEWTILENYLIANGYNEAYFLGKDNIAKALASASGWEPSIHNGTVGKNSDTTKFNTTGFTALPGGGRYVDGTFFNIGFAGYWWCNTEYTTSDYAFNRSIFYSKSKVYREINYKESGFYVRCVRD